MMVRKSNEMITNLILTIILLSDYSRGEEESLRVYVGHSVDIEEIPYIVSISIDSVHICGGTIISPRWIITAAHCVANKSGMEISAGLVDLQKPGNQLQVSTVKKVVLHPDYHSYKKITIINDVALVELTREFRMNRAVSAIELIDETYLDNAIKQHKTATIAGWGANDMSVLSYVLIPGTVELMSHSECSVHDYRWCEKLQAGAHICSKIETFSGVRSSPGPLDDGGPLVVGDKLAGIILHGKNPKYGGCSDFSVYASVPYYKSFIESNIPELLMKVPDSKETTRCEEKVQDEVTIFQIEFAIKYNDEVVSNQDGSISQSFSITWNFWWFDNGSPSPSDMELATYIYNIKFVKSTKDPKTCYSFKLSDNLFITPYFSVRYDDY